jgi:hypothetical protein
MQELGLGDFVIFCKDFDIKLSKAKITEIYKRQQVNNKNLKFDQFVACLMKVAHHLNDQKIEEIITRIKEINSLLGGEDPKKNLNSNGKGQSQETNA